MITVSPSNTQRGGSNYLPYLPSVAMQTANPQFYMTAFPLQFDLLTAESSISSESVEMQALGRNLHAIQVSGTFVATVLVEATLDGVNWSTIGTITAPGITQYSGLFQSIRVSVSAYTSGVITVTGITMRS